MIPGIWFIPQRDERIHQNHGINDSRNGLTEVSVAVNDERKLGIPPFHSGRVSALFFDSDRSSYGGEFFPLAKPDLGSKQKNNNITKSEDEIIMFAAFITPGVRLIMANHFSFIRQTKWNDESCVLVLVRICILLCRICDGPNI